jgi:very-short-patch-repair endonuclease
LVDALWREEGVIVELDGAGTHGRPAAVREDRERELTLRSAGFIAVRYSRDQVVYRPAAVADDALRTLAQARQRNASPAAMRRAA